MGAVPLFLPFPSSPFFLPLEVGPLKPARGLGERCKPKTNLVHSKAVRKPLEAIISNIWSTMFYVFEEINWRRCRHNTVSMSHQEYHE